jgi:hypothetical protein
LSSSTTPPHPGRQRIVSTITAGAILLALVAVIAAQAEALPSHCSTTDEVFATWQDPTGDTVPTAWDRDTLTSLLESLQTCRRFLPPRPGTTPNAPPANSLTGDPGRWRDLAALYFEPGDLDRVVCLIDHESGGNPNARNQVTAAAGLLQVMPFWADAVDIEYDRLFEPEVNLWLSRQILELQGWDAWSPFRRGACQYRDLRSGGLTAGP